MYKTPNTELNAAMGSISPPAVELIVSTNGKRLELDVIRATLTAAVGCFPSFSIGNVIPSTIALQVSGSAILNEGEALSVAWRKAETEEEYPLFFGILDGCTASKGTITINAYDALYRASAPYDAPAAVLRPCTAADVISDVAGKLGVAVDSATLTAARNVSLSEGIANLGDEYSMAQALSAVSAVMGGNVIIDRNGKLRVKTVEATGWTAEAMAGADQPDTTAFAVSGVKFLRKYTAETEDPIPVETVEEFFAGNPIVLIQDNQLATSALASNAMSALSAVPAFNPARYTIAGGMLLEPGDVFDVLTASGSYTAYAAQVSHTIDGGCTTAVECWGAAQEGGTVSPTQAALNTLSADLAHFERLTAGYAKISKAEIDELKIGAATIEGTVNGLKSTVKSAQDTANSASTAAATAQSTADSANTAANAAQAGVERVTERVATVEQTAEGLTARVTATESVANSAMNKIDGLSVGGRNLIVGSNNATVVPNWAQNGWNGSFSTEDASDRTYKIRAINGWRVARYKGLNEYAGKNVTISFDAKCVLSTADTSWSLFITNDDGSNPYSKVDLIQNPEKNKWYHAVATVLLKNDGQIGIGVRASTEGVGHETVYHIKNLKLELGNIATDWTPAPEDIEERIVKAESSITQNATEITQKVSKTDYTGQTVASLINQSAEEVKIKGEKIEIEGNTVFKAVSDTAKDAKNAIDQLSVGGRNLLLKTDFPSDAVLVANTNTNFANPLAYYNSDIYQYGQANELEFTLVNTANIGIVGRRLASEIALDANEYYTLSAWVKLSVTNAVVGRVLSYQKNDGTWVWRGGQQAVKIPTANEWTFISITFKPDDDTYAISYGFTCNYGNNAKFSIRHMKLEKGNIATDWTPAPEDAEDRITKALETAQSKSAAYRQATAPTGADVQDGDVWFDTQGGGIYNRVNGQWSAHEVGTVSIADGAVTADKLVVDELLANAVLSQTIQAEKLNIGVEDRTSRNTYSISTSDDGYIGIHSGRKGIPIASYFSVGPSSIQMSAPGIELSGQWDGAVGVYPCNLLIGDTRPHLRYDDGLYTIPLIQHGVFNMALTPITDPRFSIMQAIVFPLAFPAGSLPTVNVTPAAVLPDTCQYNIRDVSETGFAIAFKYISETSRTIPIHWVAFA